jgi:hypothetical protein
VNLSVKNHPARVTQCLLEIALVLEHANARSLIPFVLAIAKLDLFYLDVEKHVDYVELLDLVA